MLQDNFWPGWKLNALIVVELLDLSNRKAIYFDSQSCSLEKKVLHNLSLHSGEMHCTYEIRAGNEIVKIFCDIRDKKFWLNWPMRGLMKLAMTNKKGKLTLCILCVTATRVMETMSSMNYQRSNRLSASPAARKTLKYSSSRHHGPNPLNPMILLWILFSLQANVFGSCFKTVAGAEILSTKSH